MTTSPSESELRDELDMRNRVGMAIKFFVDGDMDNLLRIADRMKEAADERYAREGIGE